ncbi:hypothetical protein [Caulobacter sp. NIBR1757]|uniref:hypothetical protein n=1 Tax=Caulobacter sp. NIBR1757 TaxID=3016000 RepID=UPI0022F0286C|nr:hypothetical protein [Caulobacter sp. NIBR1757]WGM39707.1 hypothetical protein AMEJIAPC_02633 [Caulobacter sp. NIBR1757]
MNELARLILTLALAGTLVTFLGSLILWATNEERRIGAALKRVLGGPSEATIIAKGRARGAGLSVTTGLFATAWDKGDWCMVYRLEEVTGAELLIDGEVAARVFRGENRKALDRVPSTAREVTLRLVFDDPRYPDFDLQLWATGDEDRRDAPTAASCAQAANQWLARVEAIVRRPRSAPAVSASPPPPAPKVARPAPPPPEDEAPPWDDDEEDDVPDLFDGDYSDDDPDDAPHPPRKT